MAPGCAQQQGVCDAFVNIQVNLAVTNLAITYGSHTPDTVGTGQVKLRYNFPLLYKTNGCHTPEGFFIAKFTFFNI